MRKGKWMKNEAVADVCAEYECSSCGFFYVEADPEHPPYKYCPNCGAKNDIQADAVKIVRGEGMSYYTFNKECSDCKYYKNGKCTHEHADYCQHCELWTPNWFNTTHKETEREG